MSKRLLFSPDNLYYEVLKETIQDHEREAMDVRKKRKVLDSGATTKITINNRRLNKVDFEQTTFCRKIVRLRRDNHAVSRRQRIDGYHSQARHTVDQHKVVIPFNLIHIGFQDTLTTQGIDQPYFQTRQLNVGRDKVNAFLVMDNPLRGIDRLIVDDVLHHGGESKGQVVRAVISQRHRKV